MRATSFMTPTEAAAYKAERQRETEETIRQAQQAMRARIEAERKR